MSDIERWNTALMIAIKDLESPNEFTRSVAADGDVTVEFHEVRNMLIQYAHSLLAFDPDL
jgi:hypothetical protein